MVTKDNALVKLSAASVRLSTNKKKKKKTNKTKPRERVSE